jgi:hypothetical protein
VPLICLEPPSVEPLTIAEARLHLRETVVGADIDAKIMMAVQATREMCENDCRRAFITQKWKMVLDTFPRPAMNIGSATWYGPQWGTSPGPLQMLAPDGTTGYELYIPLPPLQSIDEIAYIDYDGNAQTMNVETDLIVNDAAEPAIVLPAYGTVWPATQTQGAAVSVSFTAGYGDDESKVPACAKAWMLTQLGAMYDLRQAEMAVYRETLVTPTFIDRLLDPIRIRRY